MTIRYTCTECGAVLKIKDEKAGTEGKCPKCRTPFTVPTASEESDAADDIADSVDMPVELTPEVAQSADFDPLSVLAGPAGSSKTQAGGPREDNARKPSMADIMKDFQSSKKSKEKKSTSEAARPVAATSAETAGSAAEMLSRAYQQKRDSASAPSRSSKEIKADEERQLFLEFVKRRALPGVLLAGVLIYGYIQWMSHVPWTGPQLFEVTGQVVSNGVPAAGIQLCFDSVTKTMDSPGYTVWATTDPGGNFRLMFDAAHFGAPAGEYSVGFAGVTGKPLVRQAGPLIVTVRENEPNQFKIDL